MKAFVAACTLFLSAPPLSAAALEPPAEAGAGPWYLGARVGAFTPRQGETPWERWGLDLEIVVGRRLAPSFALELGMGGFSASGTVLVEQWLAPPEGGTSTVDFVPITLSVRASIVQWGRLSTSLLVGGGLYATDVTIRYDEPFQDADGRTVTKRGEPWLYAPGMHAGAAVDLRVLRHLSLGLDLRYVVTEARYDPVDPSTGLVPNDAKSRGRQVDGLRSSVALTYAF